MAGAGVRVGVGLRAGAGGRWQLQWWNGWVTQYRAHCWSVNISPTSLHIAQSKTFFWAYFKDRVTNTSVRLQALIDKERERGTHTHRDRDTKRT